MLKWRREAVLDIYNLLLGLFLFVTPWLFSYANEGARVDLWASGAAIVVVSFAALIAFANWQQWLTFLLGVWLILSPWVIGFTHTRAMHYSIGIGAAVAFLAALELWLKYESSNERRAASP
jgi:SPW repeat